MGLGKLYLYRNSSAFFVLGLINNFGYVIVNSAGQALCDLFNRSNDIGWILWFNIAFGIVARSVNSTLLVGSGDAWRIIVAGIFMIVGLAGIALSAAVGSWALCLIAITFIGIASSFGESVCLAYMRKYPAEIVSGWSSGTGMAGLGGSLLWLLLWSFLQYHAQSGIIWSFAGLSLSGLLYLFAFFVWLAPPVGAQYKPLSEEKGITDSEEEKKTEITTSNGSVPGSEMPQIISSPDQSCESSSYGFSRYKFALRVVWWNATNLLLVYFFEYVASVGGGDKAQPPGYKNSPYYFVRNAYIVLAVCYQIGVMISRSSLDYIKIRRVEVLTILQGINMIFWIFQAKYQMLSGPGPVWILFALMIYCGLLGGASYVNVFYLVLNDPKIPDKDRELCVNLTAIFTNVGITLSSVFIIIMNKTFLSDS
eukprot:TRINITY_DN3463_c0_g1_i2.p1 TRINITY_DN3463_c0_g1~~TRINITY_DN3463_c0_g1_i2.p1  ORF type:complete len:423 (+),score=87.72 TRINITY_DN3463_c0_g1_i2:71-1339(+)